MVEQQRVLPGRRRELPLTDAEHAHRPEPQPAHLVHIQHIDAAAAECAGVAHRGAEHALFQVVSQQRHELAEVHLWHLIAHAVEGVEKPEVGVVVADQQRHQSLEGLRALGPGAALGQRLDAVVKPVDELLDLAEVARALPRPVGGAGLALAAHGVGDGGVQPLLPLRPPPDDAHLAAQLVDLRPGGHEADAIARGVGHAAVGEQRHHLRAAEVALDQVEQAEHPAAQWALGK